MSDTVLRYGSTDTLVHHLQSLLNDKGYPLDVDGRFGGATDRAVRQFQAAHGIPVDGVVGAQTWDVLETPPGAGALDALAARRDMLWDLACRTPLDESDPRLCVLDLAISQLGKRELNRAGQPSGSNGGAELAEIVDEGGDGFPPSAYYLYHGVTDPKTLAKMPPWCALLVCWCLREAMHLEKWSDLPFGTWQGWVYGMIQWAIQHDRLVTAASIDPHNLDHLVGGIVVMLREGSHSDKSNSTKAGHCCFLVGGENGKLVTVDGNVNNSVHEMRRTVNDVEGVIVWW